MSITTTTYRPTTYSQPLYDSVSGPPFLSASKSQLTDAAYFHKILTVERKSLSQNSVPSDQKNVKPIARTVCRKALQNEDFLDTEPEAVACCHKSLCDVNLSADKTSDMHPQASKVYIRFSSFTLITSCTPQSMLLNVHFWKSQTCKYSRWTL